MSALRVFGLWIWASFLALPVSASASIADVPGVPPELQPWVEWVQARTPEAGDCREVADVTLCVWPSRLTLRADQSGVAFEQRATVFHHDRLRLPGSLEHWPQAVKVGGVPALVIDDEGTPAVQLDEGHHRVTGFIPWRQMPDDLQVPESIALIDLELLGQSQSLVSRKGRWLSLRPPGVAELVPPGQTVQEPVPSVIDSETIEVSRHLIDGVPLRVVTRIELHVTGEARELTLENPIWPQAKTLSIESNLPTRRGERGALTIQLRPGSFTIQLQAVSTELPASLAPPEQPDPWPETEIWIWSPAPAGRPSMGQLSLSGAQAVDRTRSHAPKNWAGAAYRVSPAHPLRFELLQRGVSQTTSHELRLQRNLRADHAGSGWTVVDDIRGQLARATRLTLDAGRLGSVSVDGVPQVITLDDDARSGVEVRGPQLSMQSTWRLNPKSSAIPLGGWSEEFKSVDMTFMLPHGWDVLHAEGPASLGATWISHWRPLNILALLGVVALVFRTRGYALALAAAFGLALVHGDNADGFLMLLGLVALSVIASAAMAKKLARWQMRSSTLLWLWTTFVFTAWVIDSVPSAITAVWRHGSPVFEQVVRGAELVEWTAISLLTALGAIVVVGLASLTVHPRRRWTRGVSLAVLIIASVGTLGLAGMWLAGETRSTKSSGYAESERAGGPELAAPASALRHAGEEGKMAKGAAKPEASRGGPGDSEPGVESPSARHAGILGVMRQDGDAIEPADEDLWGGLSGSELGEAYGVGGLGIVDASKDNAGSGSTDANDADNPALERAQPSAVPQTGEGVPEWNGASWSLHIDRTLESDETMRLWLISPNWSRVLVILRSLALMMLTVALIRTGWRARVRLRFHEQSRVSGNDERSSKIVARGLGGILFLLPSVSSAAPPAHLLEELAERVNASRPRAPQPECGPSCALAASIDVQVADDDLVVVAELHMAGPGVWALPGTIETWIPRTVQVDGKPAKALVVHDEKILLHLTKGVHRVELSGPIVGDQLQLQFWSTPRHVQVDARGWLVRGIDDHDMAQTIRLQRGTDAASKVKSPSEGDEQKQGNEKPTAVEFPAWYSVQRELHIGARWQVHLQRLVACDLGGMGPVAGVEWRALEPMGRGPGVAGWLVRRAQSRGRRCVRTEF